jgi:uncharacterized protein YbjT (DUF2867 family)
MKVLVVGATGSIGRLVVEEALSAGHEVQALVRDPASAQRLDPQARIVKGDLTRPETLIQAVEGVDAIVFTHGASTRREAEGVDYGGVRNVLNALNGSRPRIALMTAIGVTDRGHRSQSSSSTHDWKRRGERLVRASCLPYTIVRPGWFDYNEDTQHRLVMLQGDHRQAANPSDGVISRLQIAQVLVQSLTSYAAIQKTFELVAQEGPAQSELDALFDALEPDSAGALDAVQDVDNMPLANEPVSVRDDLTRASAL